MLKINDTISIPDSEISIEFVLSGGPGGQKVNKSATAVVLKFDAMGSPSLPRELKDRLGEAAGSSLSSRGILVIHSRRFRSQERNRRSALKKLVRILRKAAREPGSRRSTRPTAASVRKRLEEKSKRGRLKKERSYRPSRDDMD